MTSRRPARLRRGARARSVPDRRRPILSSFAGRTWSTSAKPARLLNAEPAIQDAFGRRGAADRAGQRARREPEPRALRARRADRGLHPRDTERLIRVLLRLRERGNTIVVVEHDPDVIASADRIVELGPGAGHRGGIFSIRARSSVGGIGEISNGGDRRPRRGGQTAALRIAPDGGVVEVQGAREHNLKNVTARFPVGAPDRS